VNLLAMHGPWIGAALATGLLFGWLVTRALRQSRRRKLADARELENRAYVKGVNYILENDHDAAIEELTKVVQVNTETVEIYFALGNLFRRKGEIDRAIRIHQNIILRPGIDESTQRQAYFDLGLDYKKAGFVRRAIATLEEVLNRAPSSTDAMRELCELYEEVKDWEKAFTVRQRLSKIEGRKEDNVLAHLQVELGRARMAEDEAATAKKCFKKALSLDSRCVDGMLALGDLHLTSGDARAAIASWTRVMGVAPEYAYLTFTRLEEAYEQLGQTDNLEKTLRDALARHEEDPNAHLILGRYLHRHGDTASALSELRRAIELNPAALEARKTLGQILLAEASGEEALDSYRSLLDHLALPEKNYQCARCGFESSDVLWKCPQCLSWDTLRAVAAPDPSTIKPAEADEAQG